MRFRFTYATALAVLLTSFSVLAQSPPVDAPAATTGGDKRFDPARARAITGLRPFGSVAGVGSESAGLAPAAPAGTYHSFGDNGHPARLFHLDAT